MASVAEFLASVVPSDLLIEVGSLRIYRLELVDESVVAAGILSDDATPEQRAALVEGLTAISALGKVGGIIEVIGVDPDGRGFLSRPMPSGTARDVGVLRWPLPRRLEMFRKVAEAVATLHAQRLLHGTLTPEHVLLAEDLSPVLLGPGVVDMRSGVYAAPEVVAGDAVGVRADIYTLGRFLQYVTLSADPEPESGPSLRLASMAKSPAGLARIVRKATTQDPERRYESVAAMLEDLSKYGRYLEVGLTHPDAVEENVSGLSHSEHPSMVASAARPSATTPQKKPGAKTPAKGGAAAKAEVELSPEAKATRKKRSQLFALAGLGAILLIAAIAAAIPAIRLHLARADLTSADAAKRRAAVVLVMGLDRNFRGLSFRDFDFSGMKLRAAKFQGADLEGANFSNADLNHVNFSNARVVGAKFNGADLRTVRYRNANGFTAALCDTAT
ncbi:MAG: pentapeptide repeat-containing protein, partial [Myxococcales bacterium]|nr:pentapeptide repeat-containing protein [Myxococcales bacterium]